MLKAFSNDSYKMLETRTENNDGIILFLKMGFLECNYFHYKLSIFYRTNNKKYLKRREGKEREGIETVHSSFT